MTEQELAEITENIALEIVKTEKSILGYEEMSKPISPENSIGRVSRMDAINNKSVAEAALRKAKEKLHALKYMEKQVGEEGFGLCARCKQPIPVKRLLLMPQSQNCVRCAR